MLDPAIQTFLDERKAARLKSKLKATTPDEEKIQIESEAHDLFLLSNWLPNAAKRAGQLSLVSHPGKFSHPNAKTSSIIASGIEKPDGFMRTGNVQTDLDVFGNAAALDVYKFLSLSLADGQTVLDHLGQDTVIIKSQFTLSEHSYEEIKLGLLAIKKSEADQQITSELLKQVYFPVADDYHLLSLLTASGLVYKMKQQINTIRFSEPAKQARIAEKKNAFDEQGFDEIYGLTAIGFGGTKPQNISILNSQNGGVSYLLSSMPPTLSSKKLNPPKTDFFRYSLYLKNYEDSFRSLDKLMILDRNTVHIRQGIENIINYIISQVIEYSWSIRQLDAGWSDETQLKSYQKIWLDAANEQKRADSDDWLKEVIHQFARWFIFSYEKIIGKTNTKNLVDSELTHIKALINEQKDGLL